MAVARTRTQLRQLVARQVGFDIFATGTADSGGSTSTLKDSPLQLREDDFYIGAHVYLTSGSPTFTELLVTDSTQSTGVLAVRPTLGAAPDTLTYELLPFSATQIHNAIEEVLWSLFEEGRLSREVWIRGLVAGSPAYNAGFDYWDGGFSTVPHGYEFATGSTAARETSIIAISDSSLKLTNSTVRPKQEYRRFLLDLVGNTVTMYCWVYTTAASNARINLRYIDGGTTTNNNSDYHDGNAGWTLLSKEVAIPVTAEDVQPIFDAGATAAYFSDWFIRSGNTIMEYPFPIGLMPDGPDRIYMASEPGYNQTPNPLRQQGRLLAASAETHVSNDEANTATAVRWGWLNFMGARPTDGHRLYLHGTAPLTVPSADANVVEVTATEALVIAKRAAVKLLSSTLTRYNLTMRAQAEQRIARLTAEIARLEEDDASAAVLPWQGV